MQLSHIMTGAIQTVAPGTSLAEAAKKMASADVGSLPVCAGDRKLVGIITDRDITVRAVARGLDPQQTQVQDVMTKEVLSCPADSDVEAACELMEEKQVRRLVVTDGNEAPIGIVSLGDIALSLREAQSGGVLKKVSSPE
ncbi:MAG: CBS domain-containing protein [Betaproteobacteria bacterium]|nr:CBS domain-containing protein [Betaproteobacteria bacterium]